MTLSINRQMRCRLLAVALLIAACAPAGESLAADYTFTTIVDNGGPGPQFTALGQRKINDSGEVTFLAEPSFASHRIYKGSGGGLTQIASGSYWGLNWPGNGAIDNSGNVTFVGGLSPYTIGIYRGDGGNPTPVVIGDQSPATAGTKTYFVETSVSNSGNIAYRQVSEICDANDVCSPAVHSYTAIINGSGVTVAQNGATWSSIPALAPVVNDAGQVAFTANATSDNKIHLARYDGPGITTIDTDFGGGDGYWMNNAGDVLFAEATAVRLFHNGTTTTVASTADGFNALQPSGDGQVFINDGGDVAFWASVTQYQSNPVTWQGVYVGPDIANDRVLVHGDSVFGHTVNTVNLLGLNNSGQMLLHIEAQSPDTWNGLVVATPPSADYNQNGVIDTGDYVAWRKSNINGQAGYDLWRANYGNAPASGSSLTIASVPEPTSFGLALVSAPLYLCRRSKTLR